MKHHQILIRVCIAATCLSISLVGCNERTTDQPITKTEQPSVPPSQAIPTPAPLVVAPKAIPSPATPKPNLQKLHTSQQALAAANAKARAKQRKRIDAIQKQLATARASRVAPNKYNWGAVSGHEAKIRSLERDLMFAGLSLESQ